jgi:hypothetical protein
MDGDSSLSYLDYSITVIKNDGVYIACFNPDDKGSMYLQNVKPLSPIT